MSTKPIIETIQPTRPARLQLSQRASYALVAAIIFVIFFASTVPSPLYALYQQHWHFSSFALTAVFAVYAFGVLLSLLLVGRLSDLIGRRPVLLAGLSALALATIVFATAQGLPWLFLARFIQGMATGALSGTVSAALADLEPSGDSQRAALVNTISFTSGSALGPLFGGLMLRYAPAPMVLPYVVLLVLAIVSLGGVLLMREPLSAAVRLGRAQSTASARPVWWPRRPTVPAALRPLFGVAAMSIIASWSAGSIFAALGASITNDLLQLHNPVLGGLTYCLLAGVGGITQVVCRGWNARRAQLRGALFLVLGMLLVILSTFLQASALFFVSVAVVGLGFGLAFMGSLRAISDAAPAHQRAEVLSAYYVVGYLAMSVPVMVSGRLVDALGLHSTVLVFAIIIMLMSVLAWVAARRATSNTARQSVSAML